MKFSDDQVRFQAEKLFDALLRIGRSLHAHMSGCEMALSPFKKVGLGVDDEKMLHQWGNIRQSGQGWGDCPDISENQPLRHFFA